MNKKMICPPQQNQSSECEQPNYLAEIDRNLCEVTCVIKTRLLVQVLMFGDR